MSDEYAKDLFWHALNYRGAANLPNLESGNAAEQCWQQLLACHERLIAEAVAAERERCAKLCQQVAEENADQDSYHWAGCMNCMTAIEGRNS